MHRQAVRLDGMIAVSPSSGGSSTLVNEKGFYRGGLCDAYRIRWYRANAARQASHGGSPWR